MSTADAINSLRPGAEWSLDGDDIANIVWHTPGVLPLTQAEVDAEVARLTEAEAARAAAAASARQKIAEASGLTPDEMAALGF